MGREAPCKRGLRSETHTEPRSPADLSRRPGIAHGPSPSSGFVDASAARPEKRRGLRLQAHHSQTQGGLEGFGSETNPEVSPCSPHTRVGPGQKRRLVELRVRQPGMGASCRVLLDGHLEMHLCVVATSHGLGKETQQVVCRSEAENAESDDQVAAMG